MRLALLLTMLFLCFIAKKKEVDVWPSFVSSTDNRPSPGPTNYSEKSNQAVKSSVIRAKASQLH